LETLKGLDGKVRFLCIRSAVSANDPRVEFRPGPKLRVRLEEFRQDLSRRAGRNISMSELVKAIVTEFMDEVAAEEKK